MRALKNRIAKLFKTPEGSDVLEYALIAGLIVVTAVAVLSTVGTKVLARWSSLDQ